MNWLSFLDLLLEIYKKKEPDLDKIQNKGLLAMKIAQVYALRVDFLHQSTCQHLAELYRRATPIASDTVNNLLDAALVHDVRTRLENVSREPLGSASVGQVHTALLDQTHDVVIKIIKTDARKAFMRDIASIRAFIKVLLFFCPLLAKVADPLGVIVHIQEYTMKELDLTNEVAGQDVLRAIYEEEKNDFDLTPLAFPHLYREISNERLLIAECVKGRTFDELLEAGELPYERLIDLFRIHGYYIFKRGVFHGDLHPGNIMLAEGKIYFIDTSAIATVPARYRSGLFLFFDALTQSDYALCVDRLHDMSSVKLSNEQLTKYKTYFLKLYKDFSNKAVAEVSLTRQMMLTIKSSIHHGMEFETGIFAIIKSFMYLDGMVLKCNPGARLLNDMQPFMPPLRKVIGTCEDGCS